MKHFSMMRVKAAIFYSAEMGGQALHTHNIIVDESKAPQCFVNAIKRGVIAHLFDTNTKRLIQTARQLGVRVIYIDRDGTDSQHIDLCAGPLRAALKLCGASHLSKEELLA